MSFAWTLSGRLNEADSTLLPARRNTCTSLPQRRILPCPPSSSAVASSLLLAATETLLRNHRFDRNNFTNNARSGKRNDILDNYVIILIGYPPTVDVRNYVHPPQKSREIPLPINTEIWKSRALLFCFPLSGII
ncbi:hypothetical protein TNCV_1390691 [Trichonephila clavipes]|nr:hypothetical protein TNCV_1390691 [Trichonephila clavipes]